VPRKILPDLADAARDMTRSRPIGAEIARPRSTGGHDSRGSIRIPDVTANRKLSAAILLDDRDIATGEVPRPRIEWLRLGQGREQLQARRDAEADPEADDRADDRRKTPGPTPVVTGETSPSPP
jgi:hypothetical protein